jgi:flagellum-specific ATP synthase
MNFFDIDKINNILNETPIYKSYGRVSSVKGVTIEGVMKPISLGALCDIEIGENNYISSEVVGFKEGKTLLMPLGNIKGIKSGDRIIAKTDKPEILVGDELIGRVIDSLSNPVDNLGELKLDKKKSLYNVAPNAMERELIDEPLDLGIKTINGLLTTAKGQRVGIMAGSGVGKSVLMGMIAKNCKADINVIALIGERGRELREFIEDDLGKEGLARSVVVVATSDRSPLERVRASYMATSIAEYFRDKGMDVLLMMDSLTRFAMAQREIGLAIGEPPTTKGYTPSVFDALPKLLERAGKGKGKGSITGLYTVLVDGDDMNDPIGDAARSILDGHIVLSRDLAAKGHYPAIDILYSASRVMNRVITDEQQKLAIKIKKMVALYNQSESLISIGAYVKGNNKDLDEAVDKIDMINKFLIQDTKIGFTLEQSVSEMKKIVDL